MGVSVSFSSRKNDYSGSNPNNPDPMNFVLDRLLQVSNNVVCHIQYKGCTNYDGYKICVFENTTTECISKRINIDPHFYQSEESPFARFKPTKAGWKAAILVAQNI